MNPHIKNKLPSAVLKLLLCTSCILGIVLHGSIFSGDFLSSTFTAFTTQSNIWISLICIVFLILELAGKEQKLQILHTLKFMFTSSILLTWAVFAVLLAPLLSPSYILSPTNLFLHTVTPIVAAADYLLFDDNTYTGTKNLWTVLIMPFLYTIFAFICYEKLGSLPTNYFFLDYKKNGWFVVTSSGLGTGFWIIVLSAILYSKGFVLLLLKRKTLTQKKHTIFITLGVMGICSVFSTIFSLILNS